MNSRDRKEKQIDCQKKKQEPAVAVAQRLGEGKEEKIQTENIAPSQRTHHASGSYIYGYVRGPGEKNTH